MIHRPHAAGIPQGNPAERRGMHMKAGWRGVYTTAGRRGMHTVELILALPVILIATLAVFQFGIIFLVLHSVTTAAILGAREGASGGSLTEVQTVVNHALSPYGVDILVTSTDGNIRFEQPATATNATLNPAGMDCTPIGPSTLNPGETRVTVCLKLIPDPPATSAWGNGQGIPDWLATFGFGLGDRHFEVSALAYDE